MATIKKAQTGTKLSPSSVEIKKKPTLGQQMTADMIKRDEKIAKYLKEKEKKSYSNERANKVVGKTPKAKDGKWMQKVSKSIKARGTEGKCTPITKPGCTGRAKALAKTFKKIAAKRKAK
jgi:hypothetical protein